MGQEDLLGIENQNPISRAIVKPVANAIQLSTKTGLQVTDMSQAMEVAKLMAISGQAVPGHLRSNPGACLAIAIQAYEWAINPFALANKSYSVNDRLAYESALYHAVVLRRAPIIGRIKIEYSGEALTRRCKVSAKARPEEGETNPEPVTYETPKIGDIKPQNSPLWRSDPDQQLFYYAIRAFTRRHFPDVMMGVYTNDELQDDPGMIQGQDSAARIQQIVDSPLHAVTVTNLASQSSPAPVAANPPAATANWPSPAAVATGPLEGKIIDVQIQSPAADPNEAPKKRGRPVKTAEVKEPKSNPEDPAPVSNSTVSVVPVSTAQSKLESAAPSPSNSEIDPDDIENPENVERLTNLWSGQAKSEKATVELIVRKIAERKVLKGWKHDLFCRIMRDELKSRGLNEDGTKRNQVEEALDDGGDGVEGFASGVTEPVKSAPETQSVPKGKWDEFIEDATLALKSQSPELDDDAVAAKVKTTCKKLALRNTGWLGYEAKQAETPKGQEMLGKVLAAMADGKWNWADAKAM